MLASSSVNAASYLRDVTESIVIANAAGAGDAFSFLCAFGGMGARLGRSRPRGVECEMWPHSTSGDHLFSECARLKFQVDAGKY